MLIFSPRWADALGCWPSRLRWQSGHGVTIVSAPCSRALVVWFATIFMELRSLMSMMGKPQHLVRPGKFTGSAPAGLR